LLLRLMPRNDDHFHRVALVREERGSVHSIRAYTGLLVAACLILFSSAHAVTQAARQEVASSSALLVDLRSGEVLYASNADVVVPIASITKLMTAMVVLNAQQPLDEMLPVMIEDVTEMRGVFSRVRIGSTLSRRELLQITLMSSENRAAATLAHHYPGGVKAFVLEMNFLAKANGMAETWFAEPTGLSRNNLSTAEDLVKLVRAIDGFPLIGQFSRTSAKTLTFGNPRHTLEFRNTNYLVNQPDWQIGMTKTGFTNAAGRCLVMKTEIDGRPVAFVLLDGFGKQTHTADATRLKRWIQTGRVTPVANEALAYRQQRIAQRSR
jgi:serine-type D-Ala-D-Ala endopeptidase (penicillin-binding protein 7)